MGRDVCMKAIEDPDSLADVVQSDWMADGIDAEAEIYAAGFRAWQIVTGVPDDAPYPVQNPKTELAGDDFDFDNDEAMRHALPRLFTLIGD